MKVHISEHGSKFYWAKIDSKVMLRCFSGWSRVLR